MNTTFLLGSILGSVILVSSAQAGDLPSTMDGHAKGGIVDPAPTPSRWRFGASAGVVLGVEAEFSRLGRWESPFTPSFGTSGIDRTYDNGFNNVDSSGNAGNLTWNWGYQDNAQYDAGSGTLALSTYESFSNASVDDSDDPQFGFNIFGLYDMGVVNGIQIGQQPTRWGIKAGLGYQRISIGNRSTLVSDVLQSTDTFALNGVIPPLAPYSGSFAGPGALMSDVGVFGQQTIAGGASVVGSRDLDADLFLLALGPYLEFPINDRVSLYAETGLNVGLAHGNYAFTSTTSIPGFGAQTTRGEDSETKFIGGVYAGLGASYSVTENWSLYTDAKYQYLTPVEIDANGSQARLNFDGAFVLSLGVLYKF